MLGTQRSSEETPGEPEDYGCSSIHDDVLPITIPNPVIPIRDLPSGLNLDCSAVVGLAERRSSGAQGREISVTLFPLKP